MNDVWIITFVDHLHVWVTKLKPSLMFFKLPVLTSINVAWVNFSAAVLDKTQRVAKTSTVGYVPVCYEIVNLFIKPQHFLLMFFICKLKGLYLVVTICDGFLMLSLDLLHFCIKPTWHDVLQNVLLERFTLIFLRVYNDIKGTSKRDKNIMILSIFPRGSMLRIPASAWRKAWDLISSSVNLGVNVMIRAIPKYFPTWPLFNQFCSSLSTSTSI